MEFIRKNKEIVIILTLLMLVIVATVVAAILGAPERVIYLIAMGGTGLVLVEAVIYVVLIDSVRRWPNKTGLQRLRMLLTFER